MEFAAVNKTVADFFVKSIAIFQKILYIKSIKYIDIKENENGWNNSSVFGGRFYCTDD